MKVFDVMSKQVDFVASDTSVRDVCRIIFGRGINGVPVCKGKKVVGFITEHDILSKFYPSMQEYMEDPVHMADFEGMEEKASEIFALTAEKIMSKDPTTVDQDTPLLRANSLMSTRKVGRLPVVDSKGNLTGILSKGDVFRAAVGDRLELDEDEEYNDWLSKRYYQTVDVTQRLSVELPDLIKVFKANKVEKILDAGCGTGDHVIALAEKGFKGIGIDRSNPMIRESHKRLDKASGAAKQRVKFLVGGYEELISNIDGEEKPDAVMFMGNTISHNPYNFEAIIKKTAKVLPENGVMIFQIENFEKVFKKQNGLLEFTRVKADYTKSPFVEHIFVEYLDPSHDREKTILKTFAIFDFDGKRWKFYGLRSTLFAYITKEKIEKVLKVSGYKDISFYGSSFDGRKWDYLFRQPFKPLEHDWLNVVAKK
ncbi:MAG: CBS domain-containing protein [bacterium]|nr:CBS domain-containing protein [bacterium]